MQPKVVDAKRNRILPGQRTGKKHRNSCFVDETRVSPEIDIASVVSTLKKKEAVELRCLKNSSFGRH